MYTQPALRLQGTVATVYTRRHCHTCTDSHTHQCYVVRIQMILIILCLRRVWIQPRLIGLNPQSINAYAHHQHYGAVSSYQLITTMIACDLSITIHSHLEDIVLPRRSLCRCLLDRRHCEGFTLDNRCTRRCILSSLGSWDYLLR